MSTYFEANASQLPVDYFVFVTRDAPFEGDLGEELGYVHLWSVAEINDAYSGYNMSEYLAPEWFPIGTDMGGELFALNLAKDTKSVFRIPLIGMEDEDVEVFCRDYTLLLRAVSQDGAAGIVGMPQTEDD